jgi:hypothetical protein
MSVARLSTRRLCREWIHAVECSLFWVAKFRQKANVSGVCERAVEERKGSELIFRQPVTEQKLGFAVQRHEYLSAAAL